ncbi:MAG: SDR family NAD(P)-dependent oxidoreductase [Clostridia bacterium]|nr:SDR family NAD(P)-dependent oxidoreductase [Clostridia bacterium]
MSKMRKTAVVTGGSGGIGGAICEALLEDGYEVAAVDVAGAARESDGLYFYRCDVSSFSDTAKVCADVLERFGGVYALVNNAGIQTHCALVDMTEELWDRTLDVNLKGAFCMCRHLLPSMLREGAGRIVNIASMSARRGSNLHTHYCASKAGLLGFTRALSLEAACRGVTVNAICPGIVETDIVRETLAWKRETWLDEMHVKRLGKPEDIASAVMFLMSEASDWITGQAFDINGGIITP